MDQTSFTPFPETHVQPPDYAITYVISLAGGDVHAFVPDTASLDSVKDIADNFSRRVQQPVKVFWDSRRKKFRLCPLPEDFPVDTSGYGLHIFSCGQTKPEKAQNSLATHADAQPEKYIPRPCNSWILFRKFKCREISEQTPGLTAGKKSSLISGMWAAVSPEERQFWQDRAKEEDRIHKELYPDYKFTTKKSPSKKRKASSELL